MFEAEFDRFADEYRKQHAHSIRFSGENPEFFAAYKVAIVSEEAPASGDDHRILDFGGGIGNSLGHFRQYYPDSEIVVADPSSRSLDIARGRFPAERNFCHLTGDELPFEDETFHIAFAACVFHHIPAASHLKFLSELRRVLRPGGSLFVFEHNPYNPLTRKAVNDCEFDAGVTLITAREMRSRLRSAGFDDLKVRYRIFFPGFLRNLRPIEPWMGRVPLGGQFYAHARV
ncbi:MAG: methyltransferase domain-containing protein [Flavobacteriaceae bacterium]